MRVSRAMHLADRLTGEAVFAVEGEILRKPCRRGACSVDGSGFAEVRHYCWRHDLARRKHIACRLYRWRIRMQTPPAERGPGPSLRVKPVKPFVPKLSRDTQAALERLQAGTRRFR